jgi:hypothetical protein
MEAVITAGASDQQIYTYGVHYSGDGRQDVVSANLDAHGNLTGIMAAASLIHYPILQSQSGQVNLKCDGKALDGTARLAWQGPWLDAMKIPYVAAAKETKGFEAFGDALQNLQLLDSKLALTLQQGNLDITGATHTSDLTALCAMILHHVAPNFTGQVLGLDAHCNNPAGHNPWTRMDLFLAGLPTAPAAALHDLRQIFHGELNDAKVRKAATSELTPPTLTAPTVPAAPAPVPAPQP